MGYYKLPGNLTGIRFVGALFVIGIAAQAGLASLTTNNYFQFYRGVSNLAMLVTQITLTPNPPGMDGTAAFTIQNPTSYQGLVLTGIDGLFNVKADNGTILFRDSSLGPAAYSPNPPLEPSRIVAVSIPFGLPAIPSSTPNYYIYFTIYFSVSTLFDQNGPTQLTYACNGHHTVSGITLGNCEQTNLAIYLRAGGLGGGGG